MLFFVHLINLVQLLSYHGANEIYEIPDQSVSKTSLTISKFWFLNISTRVLP